MKITNLFAMVAVAVAGAAFLPGCDDKDMRPDKDAVLRESGLQSADLREMTDKLAPQIMQLPEIVGSPFKITVVVKPPENRLEGESTKDMSIFVQRLANNLERYGSTHIAFIEERATYMPMAAQEGAVRADPMEAGSRYPGMVPDPRIVPQFALYGSFHSMRGELSTYYLCTFKLTNLSTGQSHMWEWDTRTRNLH